MGGEASAIGGIVWGRCPGGNMSREKCLVHCSAARLVIPAEVIMSIRILEENRWVGGRLSPHLVFDSGVCAAVDKSAY